MRSVSVSLAGLGFRVFGFGRDAQPEQTRMERIRTVCAVAVNDGGASWSGKRKEEWVPALTKASFPLPGRMLRTAQTEICQLGCVDGRQNADGVL